MQSSVQKFIAIPHLSRTRIVAAVAVAVFTDAVQWLMGPLGWAFADEISDVVAMALTVWLLGFHPLLLPTFVMEFLPVVDMLPTWTACVTAVVVLRRRKQKKAEVIDLPP